MDGPDQLLLSEREHQLSLKLLLETQLSKVQCQLQELSMARARLYAAIQERSRVTDLLCQSMMSAGSGHPTLTRTRPKATRPSSGSSTSRSQTGLIPEISGIHAKTAASHSHVNFTSRHAKSFSAPVPLCFVQNTNLGLSGYGGTDASGSGKGDDREEDRESLIRRPTPPKSARASNDGEATQIGTFCIYTTT